LSEYRLTNSAHETIGPPHFLQELSHKILVPDRAGSKAIGGEVVDHLLL
jgi:hypothetical protein